MVVVVVVGGLLDGRQDGGVYDVSGSKKQVNIVHWNNKVNEMLDLFVSNYVSLFIVWLNGVSLCIVRLNIITIIIIII